MTTDRAAFVGALARKLIQHWPDNMGSDEALGFLAGVADLAFPPEGGLALTAEADAGAVAGDPVEDLPVRLPPVARDPERFTTLADEPPALIDPDDPGEVEIAPVRRVRGWDTDQDAKLCRLRLVEGLDWKSVACRLSRDVPACQMRAARLKALGRWSVDVTARVLAAHAGQASGLGGVV